MKILQLVVASCLAFSVCGQRPSNAEVGQPCTPSYRAQETCGDLQLLSERNETEVAEAVFGTDCVSSGLCDGNMTNISRTTIDCCEGFAKNLSDILVESDSGKEIEKEGCPIILRESVLECMYTDNETQLFADELIIRTPDLARRLGKEGEYTVFALTDEVVDSLLDGSTPQVFDTDQFDETNLPGYVVEGEVQGEELVIRQLLTLLANDVFLHVRQVGTASNKRIFVNGAEITRTNACQARNGIVHIVGSTIPTSSLTIAEVLKLQESRFSIFNSLLDSANITKQLAVPKKSLTVFAPTNKAFDKLPAGAVKCLQREENRCYLLRFVLIHIGRPAEFSSTLSLTTKIRTFTYYYLRDKAEDAENFFITRDEIQLEEVDLPATNGVIHVIPKVILPFEIDFDTLCSPDVVIESER